MGTIKIVGVGWSKGQLTLEAAELLKRSDVVMLHTDRCGCAEWLRENGIAYVALDDLYDTCDDFDAHAQAAAKAVIQAAERGNVAYCVSDVRDRSAVCLMRQAANDVNVIPGPPVEGALLALAEGETRLVEAADWHDFHPAARENCLIREIDTRELAAEVKLRLMEVYPEECDIWMMQGGSAPVAVPLYAMDRGEHYDHKTCALVPGQHSITELERYDFEHLNEIVQRLCGPGGCPWDRAQSHESLRSSLLEESYEVIDAIDEGVPEKLYDELGDLLMLIVLNAEIARRHGEFDLSDITTAICTKMISRHTHVFGDDAAQDADQVLRLWNKNKMAERHQNTCTQTLRSITPSLPALLRAVKVLKRCADVGMEDLQTEDILHRCADRLQTQPVAEDRETWLGELLFDIAGIARRMQIDPEIALTGAVNCFIDRFERLEKELVFKGDGFEDTDAETLRKYWNSVKL